MTEEQAIEEAEKLKVFLEISKEQRECLERLIEIVQLLKIPECGSKDELIKEIEELVERIHKLNLKLEITEAKEAFNLMLKIRNDTLAAYEELMARKRDTSEKT